MESVAQVRVMNKITDIYNVTCTIVISVVLDSILNWYKCNLNFACTLNLFNN